MSESNDNEPEMTMAILIKSNGIAHRRISELEAKCVEMRRVLTIAKDGITAAIICEDGLDGSDGNKLLLEIEESLSSDCGEEFLDRLQISELKSSQLTGMNKNLYRLTEIAEKRLEIAEKVLEFYAEKEHHFYEHGEEFKKANPASKALKEMDEVGR